VKQYLEFLKDIYVNGHNHPDRTGFNRKTVFAKQLRFNLKDGFPLVTTKKINFEMIKAELLWMLSGSDSVLDLSNKYGCNIWNQWSVKQEDIDSLVDNFQDEDEKNYVFTIMNQEVDGVRFKGSVGPIYGPMWRFAPLRHVHPLGVPPDKLRSVSSDKYQHWKKIWDRLPDTKEVMSFENWVVLVEQDYDDQMYRVIGTLTNNPYSARHIVSCWDHSTIPDESLSPTTNVLNGRMSLAPCHMTQQYVVTEVEGVKHLNLQVYMRSMDAPIGTPYNIAQYALLLMMVSQVVNMVAGELVITGGDCHIYGNQLDKVPEQLTREPLMLPKVTLNQDVTNIFEFKMDDINLTDYACHPSITYPVNT